MGFETKRIDPTISTTYTLGVAYLNIAVDE